MDIQSFVVSFADFIISDYEKVSEGDNLLWQLCGTKQRYTSKELYRVFIDEGKKLRR